MLILRGPNLQFQSKLMEQLRNLCDLVEQDPIKAAISRIRENIATHALIDMYRQKLAASRRGNGEDGGHPRPKLRRNRGLNQSSGRRLVRKWPPIGSRVDNDARESSPTSTGGRGRRCVRTLRAGYLHAIHPQSSYKSS